MNILFVLNPSLHDYKYSGAAINAVTLARELSKNEENKIGIICSSSITELDTGNVTLHIIDTDSKRNVISNTIKEALNIYESFNYDVIHIHIHQMSVLKHIYEIIPDYIPVVYTQHSSTILGRFSLGYRPFALELSEDTNRNIRIICPSNEMFNIWTKYTEVNDCSDLKNVRIIRHGIDTYQEMNNLKDLRECNRFISCGRIDPNKGMLELARFCERYYVPITLIGTLGMGTMKPNINAIKYYEEFVDICNRCPCIEWIEYISNYDLRKLMSMSKGYISFSKKESFGLTVSEALSVGTPIMYIEDKALSELCNNSNSSIITKESIYRKSRNSREEIAMEALEKLRYDIVKQNITRNSVIDTFMKLGLSIKDSANKYLEVYREVLK